MSRYQDVFNKYGYRENSALVHSNGHPWSNVTVLVTNGDLDGQTPLRSARATFEAVPTCKAKVELPTGGHCVSSAWCLRQVVKAFYRSPVACPSGSVTPATSSDLGQELKLFESGGCNAGKISWWTGLLPVDAYGQEHPSSGCEKSQAIPWSLGECRKRRIRKSSMKQWLVTHGRSEAMCWSATVGVPGVARIRFSGFRVLQHRLRTTANGITAPVRLAIGPIGCNRGRAGEHACGGPRRNPLPSEPPGERSFGEDLPRRGGHLIRRPTKHVCCRRLSGSSWKQNGQEGGPVQLGCWRDRARSRCTFGGCPEAESFQQGCAFSRNAALHTLVQPWQDDNCQSLTACGFQGRGADCRWFSKLAPHAVDDETVFWRSLKPLPWFWLGYALSQERYWTKIEGDLLHGLEIRGKFETEFSAKTPNSIEHECERKGPGGPSHVTRS
eukprot:s2336_g13.t2